MIRRISSFTAGLSALLIAGGVLAAPASGPVDKRVAPPSSEQNAKAKKGKKAADEEASEEAEDTDKKSKSKKGKKSKKEEAAEEEEAEDEKPKKKGKKAKKEEPPPEEEEEKPKKKGKKGKKEAPPPEEEPVEAKDTESPTATPEGDPDELPEEEPAEPPPASDEEPKEAEKEEASASVSTEDLGGKLFIGVRLGFGLFMGKATGDDPALVDFSNKIPIWLDLGYRVTPNIMVGAYGQYAFATMKCPEGFFCSGGTVMRFGLQAEYFFAPDATFAPWAGLGVGYEIANGNVKTGGEEGKFSIKGVEFANLQLGGDYMFSKTMGVGPFLSFSVGRYSSGDFEVRGTTDSGGIAKKEFHEWVVFGVRGAFSL